MNNGDKMNKFEKVRIISARALELTSGAIPKIDITDMKRPIMEKDYVVIAQKELDAGLLDLEIYKQDL